MFSACAATPISSESEPTRSVIAQYNTPSTSKELYTTTAPTPIYTTEGGYIWALQTDDAFEQIVVTYFGETFRVEYNYSFSAESLLYTQTYYEYIRPFYMEDGEFHLDLKDVTIERNILKNGVLYAYNPQRDTYEELPEADKQEFIEELETYIVCLGEAS